MKTDGNDISAVDFSTDGNSVVSSGDSGDRVVFESLRNFSSWQFSELRQSFLRELESSGWSVEVGALGRLDSLISSMLTPKALLTPKVALLGSLIQVLTNIQIQFIKD